MSAETDGNPELESGTLPDPETTLLVVDDEPHTRDLCRDIAAAMGLQVRTAGTTEEAMGMLDSAPIDLVVTDLAVPELGGLELLRRIRARHSHVQTMVLTQYGTIESAVEAMRLGAADYATKPFHLDDLRAKLSRMIHSANLDRENRVLREQLRTRPGFGSLIGTGPRMQRVYNPIEKVSQHSFPVLLLGESGTGKEMVARSIHFSSPRSRRPFVPVDGSALAPTLVESELFGYERGAFTGAMQSKQGLIEAADGGTLFLDEIGNLSLDVQVKLLRVLQEREIKPVGAKERRLIDIRVIAATNRDLETSVKSGEFRQDLFFRLNIVQIKLPPLRERKGDIPLLVQHFLEKFSSPQQHVRGIAEEALRRLMAYDWPGNVRELENVVQRALALGSGPLLHSADLPSNLQYGTTTPASTADALMPIEELERRAILRALKETAGDKLAAARLLGIGKTTLYRKLKRYESQPLRD